MNTQKLPLIVGFNLIIAVADVILLSRGLLSFTGSTRLIILIVSIIVFIAGNYLLLSNAFQKPVLKNRENAGADEFEHTLKSWRGMSTPFSKQIDIALRQLQQFRNRKEILETLPCDWDFGPAVDEVEKNMYRNLNLIINRLLIYDKEDNNDINRSRNYIVGILQTNEKYLDVFRKFIDEVAMIGEVNDAEASKLSLLEITESLAELRMNSGTDQYDE